MTAHLNHGVKAKMCETTPFVKSVGSQYIAARAQLELACDSIRKQGPTRIGLADGTVHPATDSNHGIAKSLLKDMTTTWSTLTMMTTPFQQICSRTFIQTIRSFFLANLIIQDVTNGVQCSQI